MAVMVIDPYVVENVQSAVSWIVIDWPVVAVVSVIEFAPGTIEHSISQVDTLAVVKMYEPTGKAA
jgi:accessory gene regulator protein AgrB